MLDSMSNPIGPRTIEASEFKATCLKLMDEVAENGGESIINKNGRPTAKLVPYREKPKPQSTEEMSVAAVRGGKKVPLCFWDNGF